MKKYIIPLIIILIVGASCFFIFHEKKDNKEIGKINEKQTSETPVEKKDKKSKTDKEAEDVENNAIGDIEYDIPENYSTSDYSFDLSQTYTSKNSYFMVSKDEDADIDLYKDLYANGEMKDIGDYSGYYYKTQIDEEIIHGYVFEVNNELYHITSSSYNTIEDFVKSIRPKSL